MYSTGSKQGYHFVWNGQFSVGFLGFRRSKMSPTDFIEVYSLGVQKVIFEGFSVLILKKISKNLIF